MENLLLHPGEALQEGRYQGHPLPAEFNDPFDYLPHPLVEEAARCVMHYLQGAPQWQDELAGGKMFGVLVALSPQGRLGYLAAFSGNLCGTNRHPSFVPPVYDFLHPDEFFRIGERGISAINRQVAALEEDAGYLRLCRELDGQRAAGGQHLAAMKAAYKAARRERAQRRSCPEGLPEEELLRLERESQFQKAQIKREERALEERLEPLEGQRKAWESRIAALKEKRRAMSAQLQEEIFRRFTFRNARGEEKSLLEIFSGEPPAGAGECAAPKLLQYAYLNGYRPLAMGEFWYGDSPRMQLRRHARFYPSCRGKCGPILGFMLQGLAVDRTRYHAAYGCEAVSGEPGSVPCRILYEDEQIIVLDKPAGLLSVPGKGPAPSVLGELRQKYIGKGVKVFLVHRLDMHTSGVLVAAKGERVYRELQRQFALRKVEKTYAAVIMRELPQGKSGEIRLPLIPDIQDRPRQKVDFELGKEAVTRYRVLSSGHGKSLVEFVPVTGRTHQLRVHAAHPLGLDAPIEGDPLYGDTAARLMLHACSITLEHPLKGRMTFTAPLPERFVQMLK